MTNISSIGFPDTSTTAPDAAPKKDAASTAPFDSFLRDGAAEKEAHAPRSVARDSSDGEVATPAKRDSGSDEEKALDSRHDQDADAVVLSSCLAVWQMLPPSLPDAPAPTSLGEGIETIDPNSSAILLGASDAGAVATSPTQETIGSGSMEQTPDAVNSLPLPSPSTAAATAAAPAELAKEQPVEDLAAPLTSPGASVVAASAPPENVPNAKAARLGKAVETKGSRTSAAGAEVPHTTLDGIPDAKEQRTMPDTTLHNSQKPAPAAFAEGETDSKPAHQSGHDPIAADLTPDQSANDQSQGEMSNDHHEHPAPEAFTLPAGMEGPREFISARADAKIAASDTAQVIHDIERAIDRMRAQGGQQMEMRLPMRDGEEVVVKLRMEQGEVKATFQSGSEGLRQALETGWTQFAQSSADRAGKSIPAVFESPSMQSGMGGFQQSPHDRQRGGSSCAADFAPLVLPPANQKASEPRRAAVSAKPSASLEIYA